MANYKRKRSRRQVRCTLCTPHRWKGNRGERFKAGQRANRGRIDRTEAGEHLIPERMELPCHAP